MAEISSMPGQSGQNCKDDDKPGLSIIDDKTHSCKKILVALREMKIFFQHAGIHLAKRIDKLGMRSSDTAQIFFEDVRVPQKNVIGDEGMGFTYQMLQFQEERLWAAVGSEYPNVYFIPLFYMYRIRLC